MDHRILMVISQNDFRDEEYFESKKLFETKGFAVSTASTSAGWCMGKLGGKTQAEISLADVKLENYGAIVFVGGPGVEAFFDDQLALSLVKNAFNQGKIVAAICWASMILVNSGILDRKNATVWPGAKDDLIKAGVNYLNQSVVVDGKIITADGPQSARQFAEAIVILL